MTLHDDRFIYDDMPASAFERETSADKIAKLEVLRERFLLEARAFAEGVKLIDPNLIDRFGKFRISPFLQCGRAVKDLNK